MVHLVGRAQVVDLDKIDTGQDQQGQDGNQSEDVIGVEQDGQEPLVLGLVHDGAESDGVAVKVGSVQVRQLGRELAQELDQDKVEKDPVEGQDDADDG